MILFEEANRVVAVKHRGLFFLPGGGVDTGETIEQALLREIAEEIGWTVRLGREVAVAGQYTVSPKMGKHVNKISHFFSGEVLDRNGTGIEPDHELLILTIDRFAENAAHESQVWAIRKAIESGEETS